MDRAGILLLVAALVLVALLTCVPVSSNDFWLQVTIGGMIWNDRAIPRTVLFAFTEAKDYPFIAHEWLPSVVFYLLHKWLGYDALLFVKGAFGLAIFALAYRLAHRLTRDSAIAIVLAIAAVVVGNYRHFLRPELFAIVYLLLLLNLLAESELTGRRLVLAWALPLATLWANCHGSFPIALVLVALFAAGASIEAWRSAKAVVPAARAAAPYAVLGAAMALAMLINPYGWRLFAFVWQIAHWQVLSDFIIEWRSPFSDPFGGNRAFWAYVIYVACGLALGAAYRRRLSATPVLLFVVFALFATQHQRHIVLFAYVALYSFAATVDAAAVRARLGRALAPTAAGLLALGVAAVIRYGNMQGAWPHRIASENFTPPMAEHLAKLEGNVFNSYTLGAQLIHDYYPRLRPVIDSRIDAYGERYFLYTVHLGVNEQALLDFLRQYDVRYLLLTWSEFNYRIGTMPRVRQGWRLLFADQKAVLLERAP